jgi:hypothetical protein
MTRNGHDVAEDASCANCRYVNADLRRRCELKETGEDSRKFGEDMSALSKEPLFSPWACASRHAQSGDGSGGEPGMQGDNYLGYVQTRGNYIRNIREQLAIRIG